MLRYYFFYLSENILQIHKDDQMRGRVHPLQVTVLTVIDTVHHAGGIIKIRVSEVLTDRRSGIDQRPLFRREDQALRPVLPQIILPPPAEHILVMIDPDHLRLRKFRQYPFCARMVLHSAFHINVGKCRIIIIFAEVRIIMSQREWEYLWRLSRFSERLKITEWKLI